MVFGKMDIEIYNILAASHRIYKSRPLDTHRKRPLSFSHVINESVLKGHSTI